MTLESQLRGLLDSALGPQLAGIQGLCLVLSPEVKALNGRLEPTLLSSVYESIYGRKQMIWSPNNGEWELYFLGHYDKRNFMLPSERSDAYYLLKTPGQEILLKKEMPEVPFRNKDYSEYVRTVQEVPDKVLARLLYLKAASG